MSVETIDLTPAAPPSAVGKVDLTPAASAGSPGTIDASASDFTDDDNTACIVKYPVGMEWKNLGVIEVTNAASPAEFSGDLAVLNTPGPPDGNYLILPANSNLDLVTSLGDVASLRLATNSITETSSTWDVHTDGSMAANLIRLLPDKSESPTVPESITITTTAAIKAALLASASDLATTMTARGWGWTV